MPQRVAVVRRRPITDEEHPAKMPQIQFPGKAIRLRPERKLGFALFRIAALVAALVCALTASFGQERPSSDPFVLTLRGDEAPETLRRTFEALGAAGSKVEIRIAGEGRNIGSTAPAAPPNVGQRSFGAVVDDSPVEAFLTRFVEGLASGFRAVPLLADLPGDWRAAWGQVRNGGGGIAAEWRIAAILAFALVSAMLFRRATAPWFTRRVGDSTAELAGRLKASSWLLANDILTLGIGLLVLQVLRNLWLPEQDLARATLHAISTSVAISAAYLIAGRFLLAPGAPARRLMPLPRANRHYRLLAFYGVASPALMAVTLLSQRVGGPQTFAGLLVLAGFALMLFKVWWFVDGRRDLEVLILTVGTVPGPGRRIVAAAAGWIYAACFVLLWMVGNTAWAASNGDGWVRTASWTQFQIVATPILAVGVASLLASRRAHSAVVSENSPYSLAASRAAQVAASGLVWVVGSIFLARHWAGFLFGVSTEQFSSLTRQIGGVAALAFSCWVALVFLRTFFDAYAPKRPVSSPGDEDEADEYRPSRLVTIMPLIRGVVVFAVLALAALVLLSQLGVDTGPLLAGFGLLGLAVSFGARDLIRDVVGGFFFMLEDAFRVGEYVDTGRVRGTVEKISLRSMQLRHQSGQIHTVSFGPLSSLTNASRDWATVKFNVRLDHTADIEKARKTIKKIGAELMGDPEFGPYFILPVKMQGVADITEGAIVVRLKFTAKPNQASTLQREALKRVYRGLTEAEVPFASNAVTVREGGGKSAAAAIATISSPSSLSPASG